MEHSTTRSRSAVRVALGVAFVLSLRLVAMQLTDEVVWTAQDFVAAGILLTMIGVAAEVALRRAGNLPIALGIAAFGIAATVVGEADDAPGLVLLGILLIGSACARHEKGPAQQLATAEALAGVAQDTWRLAAMAATSRARSSRSSAIVRARQRSPSDDCRGPWQSQASTHASSVGGCASADGPCADATPGGGTPLLGALADQDTVSRATATAALASPIHCARPRRSSSSRRARATVPAG
jgi:hypothetical protein